MSSVHVWTERSTWLVLTFVVLERRFESEDIMAVWSRACEGAMKEEMGAGVRFHVTKYCVKQVVFR